MALLMVTKSLFYRLVWSLRTTLGLQGFTKCQCNLYLAQLFTFSFGLLESEKNCNSLLMDFNNVCKICKLLESELTMTINDMVLNLAT